MGEDVIPFAPTEGYRMGSAEKILFAPISLICLNVVGTNLVVLKFDNLCEQIHIARPCRNFLIKHAFLFYLNLDLEEISVIPRNLNLTTKLRIKPSFNYFASLYISL